MVRQRRVCSSQNSASDEKNRVLYLFLEVLSIERHCFAANLGLNHTNTSAVNFCDWSGGPCYTCPMEQPSDPFASLIGHEVAIEVLRAMISAGRLPHALVLSGPGSVGKMAVAEAVARVVLDADALATHPEVTVIACMPSPKTGKMREHISVEQVQQARARFLQTPMLGGKKVLIVAEAERLSTVAANALLKTLEEPRGSAHIILTTVDADLLLPTLRSRAQTLRLHPVARQTIVNGLVARGCEEKEADRLCESSQGLPGVAVRLWSDPEARQIMEERLALARDCVRPSVHERVLAAKRLIPTYNADHVKTRTELLARLRVLESVLRDELLSHGRGAPALHGLVQLRRDLSQHLNPKLALIRCMTHV